MTRTQNSKLGTLQARRLGQNCRHGGFTLIEMVVVLVVISLVAVLVVPLLPSTDAARLRTSARSLGAVIRYLGDRSVTTKTSYRMTLDLADNTITVKKVVNGEETAPGDPFFDRRLLAEGVTIEDVAIPRLGKLGEGSVNVDFGVAGLGEFVMIHLKGAKDRHFTVTAIPEGGRVEVLEGYREMQL
ncbi:MAG TPA: prepilin-type N-terminal cleavage/methylation domain-containing protein [Geobacteraceae bacterium]